MYRDPNLVNRIPNTLYPSPQTQIHPPVYCKSENQLPDYDAREHTESSRCDRVEPRDRFEVQPEPNRNLQQQHQQHQQQTQLHQQLHQPREPLKPQQAQQQQLQQQPHQQQQPTQPQLQLPTQTQQQQG